MTRQEINMQISRQKIHNARVKRALNNLAENEKLHARYGRRLKNVSECRIKVRQKFPKLITN